MKHFICFLAHLVSKTPHIRPVNLAIVACEAVVPVEVWVPAVYTANLRITLTGAIHPEEFGPVKFLMDIMSLRTGDSQY